MSAIKGSEVGLALKLYWVALASVVTGCSGSTDNPAEPSKNSSVSTQSAEAGIPKSCEVLTQADAAKALGHEVQRLENDGGPANLDICQYGYEGERMMDTGNASVTIHPIDIGSLRKGVTDQGFTAEPVSGLGDEAFWSKEAGLYVGKGNHTAHYLAAVGGENDEQGKARVLKLAQATVSRL